MSQGPFCLVLDLAMVMECGGHVVSVKIINSEIMIRKKKYQMFDASRAPVCLVALMMNVAAVRC